jgi:curved DNA-binding protein CbpA
VDGEDYYQVLQIDPAAGPQEVKAAFKRLALLYHPDRSDHPQATQRMQALNEAFEVLGDPEKRACYDRERAAPQPAVSSAPETAETQPVRVTRPEPAAPQPAPPESAPPESAPPESAPRPITPEEEAQLRAWLRTQLGLIFRLLFMTVLLFILSLFSGQVNIGGILLLVLISLAVIFSIVRRIRNPAV